MERLCPLCAVHLQSNINFIFTALTAGVTRVLKMMLIDIVFGKNHDRQRDLHADVVFSRCHVTQPAGIEFLAWPEPAGQQSVCAINCQVSVVRGIPQMHLFHVTFFDKVSR